MWKPIILDVECIVCNKTLQKFEHNPREVFKKMGKVTNTNRRSRTPNWSLQEKQHLLNLIKARKEVVVTKSNNGPNHSEEKDAAWNEILSELTTKFGNKFIGSSTKKVKTQWQNMKRIAREEIALHRLEMHKYTKLSLEVCHILELFKDGVFNIESEHLNDTMLTTDVEIKTECIDEDCNPQENTSISNNSIDMDVDLIREHNINALNHLKASTESDQQNNVLVIAQPLSVSPPPKDIEVKDAAAMTDSTFPDLSTFNSFQKELKEFLNYSAEEKALKMEALKEERQVVRAMRETAELNKITAEQRLKHMLWVKKQESA